MERVRGIAWDMGHPCGFVADIGSRYQRFRLALRVSNVFPRILSNFQIFIQPHADEQIEPAGFLVCEILHVDRFVRSVKIVVQATARVSFAHHHVFRFLADGLPSICSRHGYCNC